MFHRPRALSQLPAVLRLRGGATICIPRTAEVLNRTLLASYGSSTDRVAITFETGSRLCCIEESCFASWNLQSIVIPRSVESICPRCFYRAKVASITFDSPSLVRRLEPQCFAKAELDRICIPGSVETLCHDCFLGTRVHSVTFELGSKLRQIEPRCFWNATIPRISLPPTIEKISVAAFDLEQIYVDFEESERSKCCLLT
jgi:hypothetical protein